MEVHGHRPPGPTRPKRLGLPLPAISQLKAAMARGWGLGEGSPVHVLTESKRHQHCTQQSPRGSGPGAAATHDSRLTMLAWTTCSPMQRELPCSLDRRDLRTSRRFWSATPHVRADKERATRHGLGAGTHHVSAFGLELCELLTQGGLESPDVRNPFMLSVPPKVALLDACKLDVSTHTVDHQASIFLWRKEMLGFRWPEDVSRRHAILKLERFSGP